ncbi:MAG: GTPase HflX [Gammaproteobacteria bacterium]|nr:GTPase HflX [Gammaproteobacteria bacterium]
MLFDRPAAGSRAVLLNVRLDSSERDLRSSADELTQLVHSTAIEPVALIHARRNRPHPKWFIGSGKVDEVASAMDTGQADLLIVNQELTPAQQRNLEQRLERRVMTRTELILQIFADRAQTREGQLQVELAQLGHMQTRMTRGWSHLDRQRGGVAMRGAGERQIELDARMLRDRIRRVRARLEGVHRQRQRSRRRRARTGIPTVALVGYTNAGKSTLFNALTDARATVADQLFVTLDPLMRRTDIDGVGKVVLADTVGFIRDLPHGLVDAFKATLEQVAEADLLLHVVDAAAPDADDLVREVDAVLEEIGAADVPTIKVLNKADLVDQHHVHIWDDGRESELARVVVSARDATGLETLRKALGRALGVNAKPVTVLLNSGSGKLRARLYALGAVLNETVQEDGSLALRVRLDRAETARLSRKYASDREEMPALPHASARREAPPAEGSSAPKRSRAG